MKKRIVVAIDGFSSCGKSTIAKQLAKAVDYTYVDTGAMYRTVAYYAILKKIVTEQGIDKMALQKDIDNINISFLSVGGRQHTLLNGENVEDKIRSLEVGNVASRISSLSFVRRAMVKRQQNIGENKGVVMDGRDIGTVVFPDAELKIFVTADVEVRAKRRYEELLAKGDDVDYHSVMLNIEERDQRDTQRTDSPLYKADDAMLLDNSHLSIDQQQQVVMQWFERATDATLR